MNFRPARRARKASGGVSISDLAGELVIGVTFGIIGAAFVARVMQGLLFGVAPRDPATFSGVALMMTAIGVAACWIPALRTARIDPAITMRSD
jgi:putative ABC transport system permease protein